MRPRRPYLLYAAVLVALASLACARPQQANSIPSTSTTTAKDEIPAYPTRYDAIDVDLILGNDRIIRRFIDCILGRGPCTREGLELKRIIPDAIRTECTKCNPSQKKHVGKVLSYLFHNRKNYWDELLAKFDPDKSLREKYGFT
uniref:Ejaculatory bulb-specific protein 3 n=1 Tax=Cacopsylla melanoneura TaxID=428564 RepID=A0A8D9BL38_9HEMI